MAAPDVCSKTMNISAFISVVAGLGLFIIGIKGIAGNMGQLAGRSVRDWLRPTVSALFSFALLFLGLELMRQGSHDIRSSEWVGQFLAYSAQWTLLGFVVGIVLALATQSSATVTVIAMAMASAGLMTLEGQ
jgi:phosphate:Na+ symporter